MLEGFAVNLLLKYQSSSQFQPISVQNPPDLDESESRTTPDLNQTEFVRYKAQIDTSLTYIKRKKKRIDIQVPALHTFTFRHLFKRLL